MTTNQITTQVPQAPQRPIDAHKGVFGTVIVVGGCSTMMGAPALCAAAALRSGAGLVKIAAKPNVLTVAITIEPGATGVILTDNLDDNIAQLEQADASKRAILAVGPGWGRSSAAASLLRALLHGSRPVVLDADGLNLLAEIGKPRPRPGPAMIITPHPGEFLRLAEPLGISIKPVDVVSRLEAAQQLALAHHAVVVLKGHQTVVTDGAHIYVNDTGNPSLATAGSGDVLTGMIAGLLAQGMPLLEAGVLGVYLHGLAADLWLSQHGPSGLTALDLSRLIPAAFNRHRRASADQ